jgi:cell wall assembly regulator SMI1
VQKFTRPITREIELGGERIAVTLSAEGISLRPVGSRATPRSVSWAAVLSGAVGEAKDPTPEQLIAAAAALRKPPGGKNAAKQQPAAAQGQQAAQEKPTEKKAEGADDPPADRLKELLGRLEKWLAAHRPRFLKNLRPGANEAELHALQARLGRELPAELRTLLAWHNGQGEEFAGRFEEDWLLMGTGEIAQAKEELDKGAVGNGAGNGWKPEWIPFLDDDAGDYLFLDTSQAEPPVRAYWLDQDQQPQAAASLTAWVEAFVKAVEAGEYEEDPERGTFLRRRAKASE